MISSAQLVNRLTELLESGAKIYPYGGGRSVKYHAKYVVADETIGPISSSNLARKCFDRTCDFLLVRHEQEVAAILQACFRMER